MITPREFAEQMERIAGPTRQAQIGDKFVDLEVPHDEADALLVQTLRLLGYGTGCDIYDHMDKWYA